MQCQLFPTFQNKNLNQMRWLNWSLLWVFFYNSGPIIYHKVGRSEYKRYDYLQAHCEIYSWSVI